MMRRHRLRLSLLDMACPRATPALDRDEAADDETRDAANDGAAPVTHVTQTPVARDRAPRRWHKMEREQQAFDRARSVNPPFQETDR